jgi:hypothetical protein
MALVLKDRVKEQTTTTGTGTVTLGGTVSGFEAFSAVGDGNTTYYAIAHQTADEWEVGLGTYTAAGTTLSRDTILESSNSDLAVNFSAGTKDVFVTYPADKSVYKDGSDNVGIGTSSPSVKLELNNGGAGSLVTFTDGVATNFNFSTSGTVGTFGTDAGSTSLALKTAGSERMRINSSGNVGIGTSSPLARFNVDSGGVVVSSDGDYFAGGAYYNAGWKNSVASQGGWVLRNTGGELAIQTAPPNGAAGSALTMAERVRIDGSGNVGIGTTSPDGKMDIATGGSTDVVAALGGTFPAFTYRNGTGAWFHAGKHPSSDYFYIGHGATPTTSVDVVVDNSGNVGIGTTSPARPLHIYASDCRIRLTDSDAATISVELHNSNGSGILSTNGASSLLFQTDNAERMRIDSSGNVGIGTSSPSYLFTVENSSTDADYYAGRLYSVANPSGTSKTHLRLEKGNGYGGTIAGYIEQGVGSGLTLQTINGGTVTEQVRINSSGSVGIGTSSPGTYRLNVQDSTDSVGTAYFYNNGLNTWGIEIGAYTAASETDLVFTSNSVIGSQNSLTFAAETGGYWRWMTGATSHKTGTAGASEVMRIDSSGKVGIGIASPDTLLTVDGQVVIGDLVAGSANLTNFLSGTPPQLIAGWSIPAVTWTPGAWVEAVFTRDGDMGIDILASNTGSSIINFSDTDDEDVGIIEYDHATDYMRFNVNASERMRIDSSGNVGIGTTSPSSLLHLASTGPAILTLEADTDNVTEADVAKIEFSQDGGATTARIGFNSGNQIDIFNEANEEMRFGTNDSERMRLTDSGDLLVGQSSDTSPGFNDTNTGGAWSSGGTSLHLSRNSNAVAWFNRNSTTGTVQSFRYNGSAVGSISVTASATAYNTSSDYRLKENVVDLSGAIDRVKLLKPSRFNFIGDPNTTVDGFVAHEVSDVVPEAVHGEKDAVDEDGNPDYQAIDQSKLVPVLTAALQEAISKIESLEARIAALETA